MWLLIDPIWKKKLVSPVVLYYGPLILAIFTLVTWGKLIVFEIEKNSFYMQVFDLCIVKDPLRNPIVCIIVIALCKEI